MLCCHSWRVLTVVLPYLGNNSESLSAIIWTPFVATVPSVTLILTFCLDAFYLSLPLILTFSLLPLYVEIDPLLKFLFTTRYFKPAGGLFPLLQSYTMGANYD